MYWSSTASLASSTAISGTDGAWDFVVLTRSGTTMTIYLNGSVDCTPTTISHSIAGANMTLGGSSTGSEVFDGKIEGIKNRAAEAASPSGQLCGGENGRQTCLPIWRGPPATKWCHFRQGWRRPIR